MLRHFLTPSILFRTLRRAQEAIASWSPAPLRGAWASVEKFLGIFQHHQILTGQERIRTSEACATGLQPVPFGHLGTCPRIFLGRSQWASQSSNLIKGNKPFSKEWSLFISWRWDSNPQPLVYKTRALPLSYASMNFRIFKKIYSLVVAISPLNLNCQP